MILGVIALLVVGVFGVTLILRIDKHNRLMEKQLNLTIETVGILKASYRLNFEHSNSATHRRIADLNRLLLEITYQEKLEQQAYEAKLKATREQSAKEVNQ